MQKSLPPPLVSPAACPELVEGTLLLGPFRQLFDCLNAAVILKYLGAFACLAIALATADAFVAIQFNFLFQEQI
jgi:hypothetical protein